MQPERIWSVLGVSPGVGADAVKRSYRILALRHHPDRNPDDPGARARFDELNEAYAAWLKGDADVAATPSAPRSTIALDQILDQLGGLFTADFNRAVLGRDRRVPLALTDEEMRGGVMRELAITRRVLCGDCKGTGDATGERDDCPGCNTRGQHVQPLGDLVVTMSCALCRGRRKIPRVACRSCKDGLRDHLEAVRVMVPPGVAPGQSLRLPGKGDEVEGAPPGDLFLVLELAGPRTSFAPRRESSARAERPASLPSRSAPWWVLAISLAALAAAVALLATR